MEIKRKAYIYLVSSLLIGSFTPALLLLTKGANAFELFFIASLASIPFGLLLVAKNRKIGNLTTMMKNKRMLFFIALAALLTYVPYEYGIAYAEHFISASSATVLFRLNPILMLLFIPFILKERLTKRQVLALSIAFVGILIGASNGNISGIIANPNIMIVLFVVLLACGYALATVIIKWLMVDNDLFLSASTFVLAIFFGILFVGSGARFAPLNVTDITIILYLAVTNIFSFYMYIHALKVLKTTLVTNTFLLSPFFTFVWAAVLFSETIRIYYLAIAATVVAGILIQRKDLLGGSYLTKKSKKKHYGFVMFDVTGAFTETADGHIKDTVRNGGRVIATKFEKSHSNHILQIKASEKFNHVYTGEEGFIAKEADFVREVLGVNVGEAMVIKAGSNLENEEFFEELNNRLTTDNMTNLTQF